MKTLDMNQVQEVNGGALPLLIPVGAKVAKATYVTVKAASTAKNARKAYKAVKKHQKSIDVVATAGAVGVAKGALDEFRGN